MASMPKSMNKSSNGIAGRAGVPRAIMRQLTDADRRPKGLFRKKKQAKTTIPPRMAPDGM